jgi:hypothetical protein
MNDRDRLAQLEGLLAQLERMPASANRDFMLAEVRGRVVDVKTGMPATPLRALPRDESAVGFVATPTPPAKAVAASTPDVKPAAVPMRHPRRAPARRPAHARVVRLPQLREHTHEQAVDLLGMDGVLNLEESPPAAAPDVTRPWVRGLRG